jgi:hypothetical protein
VKIGISGHQKLGSRNNVDWVRKSIRHELEHLGAITGVTSLAAGADQLFAEIVLELGRPIEVVLPCDNYHSAFKDPAAARMFEILKRQATDCYSLPFPNPSEQAFFEAGKRIVEMSDLIIAVWNGKPAAGLGGTADIVNHALKLGKKVFHINPDSLTTHFLNSE